MTTKTPMTDYVKAMIADIDAAVKGGAGSGNWGHGGMAGVHGGSSGGGLSGLGLSATAPLNERRQAASANTAANRDVAFKRSVESRVGTMKRRQSQHRARLRRDRGTRRDRRETTIARVKIEAIDMALDELNKFTGALDALSIPYSEARSEINSIFSIASGLVN